MVSRVGAAAEGMVPRRMVRWQVEEIREKRENRTKFHYAQRISFQKALVKYWERAAARQCNMVVDESLTNLASGN